MPRMVVIGKGRRITLSELHDLSVCSAQLELISSSNESCTTPEEEGSANRFLPTRADILRSLSSIKSEAKGEGEGDDSIVGVENSLSLLSAEETVGSLTLLAQSVAQGRAYYNSEKRTNQISGLLVGLVHALIAAGNSNVDGRKNEDQRICFPRDPSAYINVLEKMEIMTAKDKNGSDDDPCDNFVKNVLVPRCILMSTSALSLFDVNVLSSKYVCDTAAALSAERLRVDPESSYGEVYYDALRPHKEMCESAGLLRIFLEGSKYAISSRKKKHSTKQTKEEQKKSEDEDGGKQQTVDVVKEINEQRKAAEFTPSAHGPAREVIRGAHKTVELEMNSTLDAINVGQSASSAATDEALSLALCQALNGTRSLLKASLLRSGGKETRAAAELDSESFLLRPMTAAAVSSLAVALQRTVFDLRIALEDEINAGLAFAVRELELVEKERIRKEKEKAERTAAHAAKQKMQQQQQQGNDHDEFKGMSEEKKAKILKKRAEKEAKKAKKAKGKEGIGARDGGGVVVGAEGNFGGLLGMGTSKICSKLLTLDSISAADAVEKNVSRVVLDDVVIKILSDATEKALRGGVQRKPKIPKGTRDYLPDQMSIRDEAFQIIRRVFKRHGAVEIDTPVFELKETLTGKYGEDSKLIYDLADQGGELLSLRYDLTVPFARFLALHTVGNIKRYHIGKVYRRDQPALARGRYREFYQCDFDIAGVYDRMVPDAECLCVVIEILDSLPIGDFLIKINHRRLLDAILDLAGVPPDKFRTICSAVDKLDKEPWEVVKREMVEEKGLKPDVADKIGTFVNQRDNAWDMYNALEQSKQFDSHTGAKDALEDMRILFQYLDAMGKLDKVSFDMSLARGLDYYTGVIYEAVCMSGNTQVGSIGGGGRYDNLVSMFQEAGKITPCVGVSVGIERVFTLMEARLREEQGGSLKRPNVSVLVASIGENMMIERMKIAKLLWDANISAEYSQQQNPKLKYEIANALDRGIPYMVIVGEEEVQDQKCKVKDLEKRTEELIPAEDLVRTLRGKGAIPVGCELAMDILNDQ